MSRQAHERKKPDGQVWKFDPLGMGLQISCVIHPEASTKDVVREYIKKPEQEDERLEQLGLWR